MRGLEGKVAIITGGAQGIGAGLVGIFAARGVKVVSADIQEGPGQKVAEAAGNGATFLKTDLRDDADIERLVKHTVDLHGGIDFLINSACTYADEGFASDRAAWRNGYDINIFGGLVLLQRAYPYLKKSAWPSVINFSSESAHVALPGRWMYPSTKAALEQITRSQAMDLAADRIRVNAVMPGWTAKPWQATAPQEVQDRYAEYGRKFHMLGRLGRVEEVAEVVLFLCSENASFVTGTCFRVDGGHSGLGPQGVERILPTSLRGAAGIVTQGEIKK